MVSDKEEQRYRAHSCVAAGGRQSIVVNIQQKRARVPQLTSNALASLGQR
jgi:hypothetical protein